MSKLDDYLTSLFISDEELEMREQVRVAQNEILNRQRDEGKRGFFEFQDLSADIDAAGSEQRKFKEENSDLTKAVAFSIPWWVYLLLAAAVFFYFGGGRLIRR